MVSINYANYGNCFRYFSWNEDTFYFAVNLTTIQLLASTDNVVSLYFDTNPSSNITSGTKYYDPESIMKGNGTTTGVLFTTQNTQTAFSADYHFAWYGTSSVTIKYW